MYSIALFDMLNPRNLLILLLRCAYLFYSFLDVIEAFNLCVIIVIKKEILKSATLNVIVYFNIGI